MSVLNVRKYNFINCRLFFFFAYQSTKSHTIQVIHLLSQQRALEKERRKSENLKCNFTFSLFSSYAAIFPLFDFLIHYDITGAIIFSFHFIPLFPLREIEILRLCFHYNVRLSYRWFTFAIAIIIHFGNFFYCFKTLEFFLYLNKYKTESHYHNELIYKFSSFF